MNYEGYSIVDLSANPQVAINTDNIAINAADIATNTAAIAVNGTNIEANVVRYGAFGVHVGYTSASTLQAQIAAIDKTLANDPIYQVGCGISSGSPYNESFTTRSNDASFSYVNGTAGTPQALVYTLPVQGLFNNNFDIEWNLGVSLSGLLPAESCVFNVGIQVRGYETVGPQLFTNLIAECTRVLTNIDTDLNVKQHRRYFLDLTSYPTCERLVFTPIYYAISVVPQALSLFSQDFRDGSIANLLDIRALPAS